MSADAVTECTEDEATAFFARLYRGNHHIPSKLRRESELTWSVNECTRNLGISTFDFDLLTRLVFLAHERCFRAEVQASNPNHVRITITKRARGNEIALCHPTLDDAVQKFRECDDVNWSRVLDDRRRAAQETP